MSGGRLAGWHNKGPTQPSLGSSSDAKRTGTAPHTLSRVFFLGMEALPAMRDTSDPRSPIRLCFLEGMGAGQLLAMAAVLVAVHLIVPVVANAQMPGTSIRPPISITELEFGKEKVYVVFGRVIALGGKPIGGAKVRVAVEVPDERPRFFDTNLLGEFRTEYKLGVQLHKKLSVEVTASKDGYLDARETAQFSAEDKTTREIILVLTQVSTDPDLLTVGGLISSLAPRLHSGTALGSVPESVRKEYERGAEDLFKRQDAARAVASLAKAVERQPSCLTCRMVLGLAHLSAGSWASADRQFVEADQLASGAKDAFFKAELYTVFGTLETWSNELKRAVGYFLKALESSPTDPLPLRELGRALILQKDWESAEQYLEKAIHAGASREARLLRARALLEEGDVEEASNEMDAYLGKQQPSQLLPAARMVYLQLRERLQLKAYGRVKSVVTQSMEELVDTMPELNSLESAPGQEDLFSLLSKVGKNVEAFFRDFPNTISLEEIVSENLRRDGKVGESASEKFSYLLLASPEKWGMTIKEDRSSLPGANVSPVALRGGFIRTSGFSTASLVFHPGFQQDSSFRYLGRQAVDGRRALVVAFAQQPDKARMIGRFDVGGVSSPVLVQGIAWIDPDSFRILRMRTDLLKPLSKVRLVKQTTEIHYGEVHFNETHSALWLPREVSVTVQWKGRAFRNTHHYSDFKLFNVETEEKRKQASLASESTTRPN